jgi:hypothetical protein
MDVRWQRLTTANDISMLLDGITHVVKIFRGAIAATVVLMRLLLMLLLWAIVVAAALFALRVTLLALCSRRGWLPLTIIAGSAALIRWCCLQQRTAADHQDTQPGNQTVWQFHGVAPEESMQQKGLQDISLEALRLSY